MNNNSTSPLRQEGNLSPTPKRSSFASVVIHGLSSGKFALVLIAIMMLISFAGVVLPQAGQMTPDQITTWQLQNPTMTSLLKPLGLFDAFICWPFLCTMVLLAINTLTGTITHFIHNGGFKSLVGPMACRRIGFLLLHVSILLLLTGGFFTAANYFEGKIILTEGQQFIDSRQEYFNVRKGLLRRNQPEGLALKLKDVNIEYAEQRYPISVTSTLDVYSNDLTISGRVEVNKPFEYEGYSVTQDETGFSPRLSMRDAHRGPILFNSFIALKTSKTQAGKEFRDFFPMTFHDYRFVVTLYPNYKKENDTFVKANDVPDRPMLLLEMLNESGLVVEAQHIEVGKTVELGGYLFGFEDLRQWSKFAIRKDPGYLLFCIGLWLALAAMILRYIPDLTSWFREPTYTDEQPKVQIGFKTPLPLTVNADNLPVRRP